MSRQCQELNRILEYFSGRQQLTMEPIWLPALWNECGYLPIQNNKEGEILVNPARFMVKHLQYLLEMSSDYTHHEQTDLDDSVIYCSLLRYSAAWDYTHSGQIQSGTFLRFMILLPLLKRMNVNILYLLPVTRYSDLNLKGDIGSPYAVYSLFDLDHNLHDPLLDDMEEWTIHHELAALVEACHLLDIKVVLDLIPRVTARDNAVLAEHPDWFYWIDLKALPGFKPPEISGLPFFTECTPDRLEAVYRSNETLAFLNQFRLPPNELDAELWSILQTRAQTTGESILTLIEQEMGITPAPAHSDWINDVQPIWTDIAFYKLYKDPSPLVRSYLPEGQPPYVLFDTIKCNVYPGDEPNQELWDMLVEAACFQLNTYNIDGFRIDIGHTLPLPLQTKMFGAIKEIKPAAILISEDLFNRNHREAAKSGYNVMLGSGWNIMTDITAERLQDYLRGLPDLQIHVFACAETADTPRITSRGGTGLSRLMAVFNYFLPNGIPYLTTGVEVYEQQPLNCGLADNTGGADIPKAFFNTMAIDWVHEPNLLPLLEQLKQVKRQYADLLKPGNFYLSESQGDVMIYSYYMKDKLFSACFNLNPDQTQLLRTGLICPGLQTVSTLIESEPGRWISGGSGETYELRPYQALVLGMELIS
ncbi:alpha-amylase [Paenibacillus tepidiphilus]|uniref:alpha-amylase n=1 Tax=Paenibacillus tepidiphilus TaxID=2608683 RepID=UPI0012386378|nr:alpha-amylase [Paenibacillus tepidiphilus]